MQIPIHVHIHIQSTYTTYTYLVGGFNHLETLVSWGDYSQNMDK